MGTGDSLAAGRYPSVMTQLVLLLAIAVAAGLSVALQGQFMGAMNRSVGTTTAVFITYGLGSVAATLIWLTRRAPLAGVRQIPWYSWTASAFGLVIVAGVGYVAPRLGLSRTIIIVVAVQLVTALLIDHFALFGAAQRAIDAGRALGLALTAAGVWLIMR